MKSFEITRAATADMEAVVDLCMAVEHQHEAYWPLRWKLRPDPRPGFLNWLKSAVDQPRIVILVAKPPGQAGPVMGSLVANIQSDVPIYATREYAYIQDISVAPPYRRLGIGQALLQAAAQWARDHGLDQFRLMVANQNPEAHAAFRKAGFVDTYQEMVLPLKP